MHKAPRGSCGTSSFASPVSKNKIFITPYILACIIKIKKYSSLYIFIKKKIHHSIYSRLHHQSMQCSLMMMWNHVWWCDTVSLMMMWNHVWWCDTVIIKVCSALYIFRVCNNKHINALYVFRLFNNKHIKVWMTLYIESNAYFNTLAMHTFTCLLLMCSLHQAH